MIGLDKYIDTDKTSLGHKWFIYAEKCTILLIRQKNKGIEHIHKYQPPFWPIVNIYTLQK